MSWPSELISENDDRQAYARWGVSGVGEVGRSLADAPTVRAIWLAI